MTFAGLAAYAGGDWLLVPTLILSTLPPGGGVERAEVSGVERVAFLMFGPDGPAAEDGNGNTTDDAGITYRTPTVAFGVGQGAT